MDETKELAKRVHQMAESVQAGETNPLDLSLGESYRDLQETSGDLRTKIDIDEMLNDVLSAKISRVQEIARILQAPELYVSRLAKLKARQLAKMMSYHQPVVFTRLNPTSLSSALQRMMALREALDKEQPEDIPPIMSGIPDDYVFQSEDSVFIRDLEEFTAGIAKGEKIEFAKLIDSEDVDEFLKRFLYVVVLISKGILVFDEKNKTVVRV
ncbi:MAG: hypothetical protein RTU92_03530 [Candidatus Thorarchaeota archaeon]